MIDDSILRAQLPFCIEDTHFDFIGEKYSGKVRDTYSRGAQRVLVTSDRLSCFDVVLTSIPCKGQVLSELANFWFEKAQSIIPIHVVANPDPNVVIGKNASVLPVEVVVRGYLTGSAWRDYEAGRAISGITLPKDMKKNQKFPSPLITPSTKAPKGDHDLPVSEEEIVRTGIVSSSVWNTVRTAALKLYDMGVIECQNRGLLLVDTKYEFGIVDGEVLLVDEMHTLDCSRFWEASEYDERFASGKDQKMLDKEPTRIWLMNQGYMGSGPIPHISDDFRIATAKHYIASYETITGLKFKPRIGDPLPQIEQALRTYFG